MPGGSCGGVGLAHWSASDDMQPPQSASTARIIPAGLAG
jgi:hypothetical protein